jgi:hypothetical protein
MLIGPVYAAADNEMESMTVRGSSRVCTASVAIRRYDDMSIDVRLYAGPRGPRTSLQVVPERVAGATLTNNNTAFSARYRAAADGAERVCVQFTGWDSDDYATVRIGRADRTNIVASGPTIASDGAVVFGYSANGPPVPGGDQILVALYFAKIERGRITPLGPALASAVVDHRASSGALYGVPRRDLRRPPAGTTHLATIVDQSDLIPETLETDNAFSFRLPNLAPKKVDRNGRTGALDLVTTVAAGDFGYGSCCSTLRVTSIPVNRRLLRDPEGLLLKEHMVSSADTVQQWRADQYPIPPASHSFLSASVDPDDLIIETNEDDNVLVHQLDRIEGFDVVTATPALDVYVKKGEFYLAVFRLAEGATIVSSELNSSNTSIEDHWANLNRLNDGAHRLRVIVNGTFFGSSIIDQLAPVDYTYGLKVNGVTSGTGTKSSERRKFFTFGPGSAGILEPARDLFSQPSYRDLVGALDTDKIGRQTAEFRNWIGLRQKSGSGSLGEDVQQTVVSIVSLRRVYQTVVRDELKRWGVGDKRMLQLDGGSSTRFMLDGKRRTTPKRPHIPHALGIFQPTRSPLSARISALSAQSGGLFAEAPEWGALGQSWLNALDGGGTKRQAFDTVATLRLGHDGVVVKGTSDPAFPWTAIPAEEAMASLTGCGEEIIAAGVSGRLYAFLNGAVFEEVAGVSDTIRDLACTPSAVWAIDNNGRAGTLAKTAAATYRFTPLEFGEPLLAIAGIDDSMLFLDTLGRVSLLGPLPRMVTVGVVAGGLDLVASGDHVFVLTVDQRIVALDTTNASGRVVMVAQNCGNLSAIGGTAAARCSGGLVRLATDPSGRPAAIAWR